MIHKIDNKTLGIKISCFRQLKGYTQSQLAERTGVSLSYIAKIESGLVSNCVSLPVINNIAKELDISIDDLVDSNKKIIMG